MTDDPAPAREGLYVCLLSIHGLIRGHDLELGRDADTGGQTRYVVELARALGARDDVARVDLITRRIVDPRVSDDYADRIEQIAPDVRIVRIDAGPEEYLRKELLWDHMDTFVDETVDWLREQPRMPDILQSHYADAGYVGSRLSHLLGIPLLHTGHSLGRVKQRRLRAAGLSIAEIEERFNMSRRISAEELTLASCERVITSTSQEIDEQYGLYDFCPTDRMTVVPPGTDLEQFRVADGTERDSALWMDMVRFFREPELPLVAVLARPVPRKNLVAQVEAFGEDPDLRKKANLVVVAGTRTDITELDSTARDVWTELLVTIDRLDLWGHVAIPRQVAGDDIALLYRLTAASRGVHLNAALTEPFGLTLIEAAASGLPIVATADGGPRDIIGNCDNGVLVDPLDAEDIAKGLHDVLDPARWEQRSCSGIEGVREHYSWAAHAAGWMQAAHEVLEEHAEPRSRRASPPDAIRYHDRGIATDIDQNLLAVPDALPELGRALREHRKSTAFIVVTGRRLDRARRALQRVELPEPDVLITSGGTRIFYRPTLTEDESWVRHIDRGWTPHIVRRLLDPLPGLTPQARHRQDRHKISYYIDTTIAPPFEEIQALLFREDQAVNAIVSFGQYLDVLPIRASKGLALRFALDQLEIPTERVLAVGGSGADEDMMRGNTLAAVLQNRHHEELSQLEEMPSLYFASQPGARGILEAAEHYDFWDGCRVPDAEAS